MEQNNSYIKTVALIIVSVVAATFIGLFIWMFIQWNEAHTNVEGQIDAAVAVAVDANTTELQAKFDEEEKNPYKTFAGPADYGSLSFSYPKTWSVYEANDVSHGGDYYAYFNPDKVLPVGDETINALRVSIVSDSMEEILEDYRSDLEDNLITANVQQINGENATVYTGRITDELQGKIAIFKIRDKTVMVQTDATIFQADFDKLLTTINFNK